MSSNKKDIEKLLRKDDYTQAFNVNKFDGKLLNIKITEILKE